MDASALVKRYLEEPGSEMVERTMSDAEDWAACRIARTESAIAVAAAGGSARDLRDDWERFSVVEVDHELCERAATLAGSAGLRTIDALHLASALLVDDGETTFATWDRRLWGAAGEHGFALVPAERP